MSRFLSILSFLIVLYTPSIAQWQLIFQDSSLYEAQDLYFFNKDTGLVCGSDDNGFGFIIKTKDGGLTWQNINTWQSPAGFFSLAFINSNVGFMAGQDGGVYKTSDGGDSWTWVTNVGSLNDIDQIYFLTDSISFIRKISGSIYKSTDQAQSWTHITTLSYNGAPIGLQRKCNPICFVNDTVGYAVYGGVFKTINQGDSWIRLPADSTIYLRAIHPKTNTSLIVVGNDGQILKSFDSGNSWSQDTICDQDLRDIAFVDMSNGYCVGGGFEIVSDTIGVVLNSKDGGLSWIKKRISDVRLNSIQIVDSVGYIVGNKGRVFKNINPLATAIESIESNNHAFSIFPNPATNSFSFISATHAHKDNVNLNVRIYDLSGVLLVSTTIQSDRNLSVLGLNPGLYIVSIHSKYGHHMQKLIIAE